MATPDDLRLKLGFPRHPKTEKTIERLGDKGVVALITLWAWAAEFRPKGDLNKLTARQIADAAKWNGEQSPEEFIEILIDIGWLDKVGHGALHIHDWKEHQPWIFFAPERTNQGKKGAEKRWGNGKSHAKYRQEHRRERSKKGSRNEFDSPKTQQPHKDTENADLPNQHNAPAPSPPPYPSPMDIGGSKFSAAPNGAENSSAPNQESESTMPDNFRQAWQEACNINPTKKKKGGKWHRQQTLSPPDTQLSKRTASDLPTVSEEEIKRIKAAAQKPIEK